MRTSILYPDSRVVHSTFTSLAVDLITSAIFNGTALTPGRIRLCEDAAMENDIVKSVGPVNGQYPAAEINPGAADEAERYEEEPVGQGPSLNGPQINNGYNPGDVGWDALGLPSTTHLADILIGSLADASIAFPIQNAIDAEGHTAAIAAENIRHPLLGHEQDTTIPRDFFANTMFGSQPAAPGGASLEQALAAMEEQVEQAVQQAEQVVQQAQPASRVSEANRYQQQPPMRNRRPRPVQSHTRHRQQNPSSQVLPGQCHSQHHQQDNSSIPLENADSAQGQTVPTKQPNLGQCITCVYHCFDNPSNINIYNSRITKVYGTVPGNLVSSTPPLSNVPRNQSQSQPFPNEPVPAQPNIPPETDNTLGGSNGQTANARTVELQNSIDAIADVHQRRAAVAFPNPLSRPNNEGRWSLGAVAGQKRKHVNGFTTSANTLPGQLSPQNGMYVPTPAPFQQSAPSAVLKTSQPTSMMGSAQPSTNHHASPLLQQPHSQPFSGSTSNNPHAPSHPLQYSHVQLAPSPNPDNFHSSSHAPQSTCNQGLLHTGNPGTGTVPMRRHPHPTNLLPINLPHLRAFTSPPSNLPQGSVPSHLPHPNGQPSQQPPPPYASNLPPMTYLDPHYPALNNPPSASVPHNNLFIRNATVPPGNGRWSGAMDPMNPFAIMPQNGFMGPGQGARMARRMNQSMGAPQNGSMLQGNQGAQMAGVRNQGLQDLGTLPNGSLGAGDQGSQMVGNEGAQMAGLMDLGPKPPQNGFLLPSNQGNQENKETQSDEQRRTKRQNTGTNK